MVVRVKDLMSLDFFNLVLFNVRFVRQEEFLISLDRVFDHLLYIFFGLLLLICRESTKTLSV